MFKCEFIPVEVSLLDLSIKFKQPYEDFSKDFDCFGKFFLVLKLQTKPTSLILM